MPIRRIAFVAFLLAATLCVCLAQMQADDPGDSLLAFLNQSIDWYHRVQIPSQLSNDPSDSIYTTYNRNASLQAVSLIFDFGRIQAEQIQLDHPTTRQPLPIPLSLRHFLNALPARKTRSSKSPLASTCLNSRQPQPAARNSRPSTTRSPN